MFKYHERTPGLFTVEFQGKAEFQGMRMIALMSKCYYPEDGKLKLKISCKSVMKKQNSMSWPRFFEVLNKIIDIATNTIFNFYEQGIVMDAQDKLGLSAYYDRQIVDLDGIQTKPLR